MVHIIIGGGSIFKLGAKSGCKLACKMYTGCKLACKMYTCWTLTLQLGMTLVMKSAIYMLRSYTRHFICDVIDLVKSGGGGGGGRALPFHRM